MTDAGDDHRNGAALQGAGPTERFEQLGYVSCPSGTLLLLDGGCAWMWSHNRQPLIPENPEIVGATEAARDLAVTGPDALAAGRAFARSANPLFIYDQSPERVEALRTEFADAVRSKGLNAHLNALPERVPHRQRVDLLLSSVAPVGLVEFHGLSAAVVSGTPRDKLLLVMGERMPAGPDEGRWRRVWIEMRGGEIAEVRALGDVWVDEARLLAIDVETLASWDDRNSQDGKADVVFWGRDAEAVAAETGAGIVDISAGANIFGWLEMSIDEALRRAQHVFGMRSAERKFAVDFRPHTHQWQVMSKVRTSPSESGTVEVAGAQVAMFMTIWGDGAFPVEADLDANGQVLRLRVELGCDKIVAQQRELDARWSARRH